MYDSRSKAVMEQHARWIAETGAGGIDISWWGPDSDVDHRLDTLGELIGGVVDRK